MFLLLMVITKQNKVSAGKFGYNKLFFLSFEGILELSEQEEF